MKEEGKWMRFINGKGFYAALGVCMIAIGISAWMAVSTLSTPKPQMDSTAETPSQTMEVTSQIPVDIPQTGIPDDSAPSSREPEEQTASEAAAPVAKYFVFPVNGEILKPFNDSELQYSLTYNDLRLHTGLDIKAEPGASVKSAGDGVVLSAEKDPLLGYTVTIDHGNGITGIYAGMTEALAVKKGDLVQAGSNLGPLGTVPCECVDAPHLHLEFREGDLPVSPETLLTER